MADISASTDVQLGEPSGIESPHQFVIRLKITGIPTENSSFPYSFSAEMEGIFTIEHDGDLDERKRLVVVNGTSILYGAARDQLLTLTARHKHGPMLLPCEDFRTLSTEDAEEEKPKVKKTTRSRKK